MRKVFSFRSAPEPASDSDDDDDDSDEDVRDASRVSPGANGRPSPAFVNRSGSPLRHLQNARQPPLRPAAPQSVAEGRQLAHNARQQQHREVLAMKVAAEKSTLNAIDALPEGVLASRSFECALCLEEVEEGMHVRQLGCAHAYHTECIDRWLCDEQIGKKRRCPLCNADPISGVAEPEAPTGSASRSTPSRQQPDNSSGISFGGVPIENLLPGWAISSMYPDDGGRSLQQQQRAPMAVLLSA